MTKVTLNDLTNLNNQQSSINTINGNNTTIETAFDNTLSRDGSNPNQMEATLDMNSNHVINLPEPAHGHEPLRLQDITNFIDQFALVQTPSPGDAGKIIRVRTDEIAYDISSIQINASDNAIHPVTNDSSTLGQLGKAFSDLFLASGAVINFNSSDVTITHSSDQLTIGGLGSYTVGSTGGLQVNNDIVTTGGAIYALGGAIPISTSVPGVYFGKESANNNRAIQIVSPAAGSAYIDFAPVSVDFDGRILVDTSAHTMAFSVNGAEEVKISGTATYPSVNDGNALGTTTNMWGDLFLASGGVINFNNGDVTLTHATDLLTFAGAANGYRFDANISPTTNDGAPLGTTSLKWADLFLASGAVINFNSGNVLLTHSNNTLTFTGASTGYFFDAPIKRDANFFLDLDATPNPLISFDSTDTLSYGRSANTWYFNIAGSTPLFISGTTIGPGTNDLTALGSTSLSFSDLFLASGAVINFNNSNYTVTHSSNLLNFSGSGQFGNTLFISGGYAGAYSGGSSALKLGGGGTSPNGAAIGWGDGSGWILNLGYNSSSVFTPRYQFVDSGAFRPANNDGAVLGTATQSWADLFLATGGVINFNNGDYTLTHSSGVLTASSDLRVTTAGTNATSVATLQGTQTFTGKTINLTNNTLSGTTAQFNTALSDDDFATLTNTVTLTNKTLTSPSISSPTVSGTFTNTQATVFNGVITPSLSADVNDWSPSGFSTATTILLTGTSSWNITGLAASSNGRLILLFNADVANTFIIKNNSTSSSVANRIQCNTDLSLLPGTGCLLYYETTNNFWRLVGGGGSGGGIANAYSAITDGTTTANAAGTDTIKFRVGGLGGITAVVGSNDPTHGDNLLISLNITGLTADTSPDRQADSVVTYDSSANLHKKVLLKDIVYPQCTVQVFTSSGTWTRPTGCRRIKATIVGGGGGGGNTTTASGAAGGGGGAGATCIKYLDVTSTSSLTVTVGAGGASSTAGGTSGLGTSNAQGQATGGGAGSTGSSSTVGSAGVAGGSATNGTINIDGGGGGSSIPGSSGGCSGIGGASMFGGGGRSLTTGSSYTGVDGPAWGSGASGGVRQSTNTSGGVGGAGIIIVEEFY